MKKVQLPRFEFIAIKLRSYEKLKKNPNGLIIKNNRLTLTVAIFQSEIQATYDFL